MNDWILVFILCAGLFIGGLFILPNEDDEDDENEFGSYDDYLFYRDWLKIRSGEDIDYDDYLRGE